MKKADSYPDAGNIQTLSETVIWLAQKRFQIYNHSNINSAVHSVIMEMLSSIFEFMADNKERKE